MNNTNKLIFSAKANPILAQQIALCSGIPLGEIFHHQFPSGEWFCEFKNDIRGVEVFLVQSIIEPANDNLMQLLVMADAARRAEAKRITAIVPYFGYARQDRKDEKEVPISARLVMDMLAAAGVNRIITMDIHSAQSAGFTNHPFRHVYFADALSKALEYRTIDVVVAPDTGALKKAETYALKYKYELAFIAKRRLGDSEVKVTQFIGDVKDKNVLILDDLAESCGTIIAAAETCKANGAKNVICAVTHNCINVLGYERLESAFKDKTIYEFYASNTNDGWVTRPGMINVIDCASEFAAVL